MGSRTEVALLLLIASVLLAQFTQAQSEDEFLRDARAPKPKFIRFGRAGQKFIRFGRSGADTWDNSVYPDLGAMDNLMEKRAGAKFIRFG